MPYIQGTIFTQYSFAFKPFLLLNNLMGGGYILICTDPVRQILSWETSFFVDFFAFS